MTFLTILKVTEILCSLRLILEGETVKEIIKRSSTSHLYFLEKFLANNFALLDFFFYWKLLHILQTEAYINC